MKRLDHFIDSNLKDLDSLEPEEGHFSRFEQKMNHRKGVSGRLLISIAASILIAAIISANLIFSVSPKKDFLSAELVETAYFYTTQSEKLLSDIQNNDNMDSSEKQMVLKDVQRFEKEYSTILTDLKKFPDDERLINAFIDFHKSRTEFLENILNQINGTNLIVI